MEKEKLIATINRLLPSVEGEDDSLITAAKLRQVLEAVYDAGVKDAMVSERVKTEGFGNKILSSALPDYKPYVNAFSYDVDLRKLQIEDISLFAVGQNITVIDNINHVTANVVVEEVNIDESYIIVSENDELISTTYENINIFSDDFESIYYSNIFANNAVVLGNNVNFFHDNFENGYLSMWFMKDFTITKNGGNACNTFYFDGYINLKHHFKAGTIFKLRDNDNNIDYPMTIVSAEIEHLMYDGENWTTFLKIVFSERVEIDENDWFFISNLPYDSTFNFVFQDGNQQEGRVLVSDANGKARWATLQEFNAISFRFQDGNQQEGRVLVSDANGKARWATLQEFNATYFRLQNGTQGSGKVLTSNSNGVGSWTTLYQSPIEDGTGINSFKSKGANNVSPGIGSGAFGKNNGSSGDFSLVCGQYNIAGSPMGNYSFICGLKNEAQNYHGFISGIGGSIKHPVSRVLGGGYWVNPGESQLIELVLSGESNNGVPGELKIGINYNNFYMTPLRFAIFDNVCYMVDWKAVAFTTSRSNIVGWSFDKNRSFMIMKKTSPQDFYLIKGNNQELEAFTPDIYSNQNLNTMTISFSIDTNTGELRVLATGKSEYNFRFSLYLNIISLWISY